MNRKLMSFENYQFKTELRKSSFIKLKKITNFDDRWWEFKFNLILRSLLSFRDNDDNSLDI